MRSVLAVEDLVPRRRAGHPPAEVLSGGDIGGLVFTRVVTRLLERARDGDGDGVEEMVLGTIHAEQTRLQHAGADPRTNSDRAFVVSIRRALAGPGGGPGSELLGRIVERYVQEIEGEFDPLLYDLARTVLPPAVSAVFRGFALPSPFDMTLGDRIVIQGQVSTLQRLVRLGTVILAPTHVSNFDALVLGCALERLALPPFACGAGLNLFSSRPLGFLMRHLGAYTVDRSKTDPIYRQTLKEYATVLLERGQHSLFFPGGTRSRSGAVEAHLKKGLLGAAPAAFRNALAARALRPRIFVVPCTLSYPLVLESSALITEYLRTEGGPLHLDDTGSELDRPRRWLAFLRRLRQLDAQVHLWISRPLDWLGNPVDGAGVSLDPHGRPVDPARYLRVDGQLARDDARDAEYTRLCAAQVLASYRRDNLALPTHVLAFVLFEQLRRMRPRTNLFRFLRSLSPGARVPVADVLPALARARDELADLERAGLVRRGPALACAADELLAVAVEALSSYHSPPVVVRRGDDLEVGDPDLLFYYRNRLEGYGLLGTADLLPGRNPGGMGGS